METQAGPLQSALKLPNGARFYKCALQINPYAYVKRHSKPTTFVDEPSYNEALVNALVDNGIEIIAIADHHQVESSRTLAEAARASGITAFPAFEAESREGIHVICIFDIGTKFDDIERVLGDCGIHDASAASGSCKYDFRELIDQQSNWPGECVCIAAHVTREKGLLTVLKGQARINAWKHERFAACAIPGPIVAVSPDKRKILENDDALYRRERQVAILNCNDVSDPSDVAKPGATCFIKMSTIGISGLRQAFLDPESRIRLSTDPEPERRFEIVAIAWEGGFLDGKALHFNEGLNVLIGGRGAGKSTIIESIRYALDDPPVGEEALRAHLSVVKNVLGNGTKVLLCVRSHRPNIDTFTIERTIPNAPTVRDSAGKLLNLKPRDVLSGVQVFSQHEISDLARSEAKLTSLIEGLGKTEDALLGLGSEFKTKLPASRAELIQVENEITQVSERVEKLPAVEQVLERYAKKGVEAKLQQKSHLISEEAIIKRGESLLDSIDRLQKPLENALPFDVAFLSEETIAKLPNATVLRELRVALQKLDSALGPRLFEIRDLLTLAKSSYTGIVAKWSAEREKTNDDYERVLRSLQKEKIDAEEFVRLRRQVEELRPLQQHLAELMKKASELTQNRRELAAQWEEYRRQVFAGLTKTAKRISKTLDGNVRVSVKYNGDRQPLIDVLVEHNGRVTEWITNLANRADLSLAELAQTLMTGVKTLREKYGLPPKAAEKLADGGPSFARRIEEVDLGHATVIELNVGAPGSPQWKELSELSVGQKATAVLMLLFLNSESPLIVDQPEDDLDNRFISDTIVPKIREFKKRRQFIFSTHNANLPVIGDAELIAGLRGSQNTADLPISLMGSIDAEDVRNLVEELLEGGKMAFETRRLKYGF
jgi:energy-coupling factor transporter ATP-binding protein EcfA2